MSNASRTEPWTFVRAAAVATGSLEAENPSRVNDLGFCVNRMGREQAPTWPFHMFDHHFPIGR